jgi:hypothetical protein
MYGATWFCTAARVSCPLARRLPRGSSNVLRGERGKFSRFFGPLALALGCEKLAVDRVDSSFLDDRFCSDFSHGVAAACSLRCEPEVGWKCNGKTPKGNAVKDFLVV